MYSQIIPRIKVCQYYTDKACSVSLQKAIITLEMILKSILQHCCNRLTLLREKVLDQVIFGADVGEMMLWSFTRFWYALNAHFSIS